MEKYVRDAEEILEERRAEEKEVLRKTEAAYWAEIRRLEQDRNKALSKQESNTTTQVDAQFKRRVRFVMPK